MGYKKQTQQKIKASVTPQAGIKSTESWINLHGKAIYVNISEADLRVINGTVSFITSVESLKRLLEGEIGGVKLGQFKELKE